MKKNTIIALRMERQCLIKKADEAEYRALYRDMQPGQNVYWNGFGDPPSLSFRASFDDIAYNRARQEMRTLIKGRFAGGNVGWIEPEDIPLFAALYQKPIAYFSPEQELILRVIEREGPLTIRQLKEETGLLVKQITPVLHRLQEAFLLYEDQYDGAWDRSWYRFEEMFPSIDLKAYTRNDALKCLLNRFSMRHVLWNAEMAHSFYHLPVKQINQAVRAMLAEGTLLETPLGLIKKSDEALLKTDQTPPRSVYAMHRNDFLYKSNEHTLRHAFDALLEGLPYDCEPLQFLLIDGTFHGACVGHFRNGPYDLNDVVCDLPDALERRDEILRAVAEVNGGRMPARFMGKSV